MDVAFVTFLAFLIAQRLSELVLSRRHERWLRAQGAVEVGQSHYPLIVSLHTAFFISLAAEVLLWPRTAASWWWIPFAVFLIAQFLRYWAVFSLGRRWTTRVLIIPGATLIKSGPYRFFRHPNYFAIVLEFACIPLIFRAYLTAAVFSLLNLILLLFIRIPAEERALRP